MASVEGMDQSSGVSTGKKMEEWPTGETKDSSGRLQKINIHKVHFGATSLCFSIAHNGNDQKTIYASLHDF